MLRIVPHTVPRVGRSYEHFPDGFELHLLQASNTPLHWAAGRGRADVVAMLLAAGADRNATKQVSQLRRHKAHNLVTGAGGS